ncbi:uncharacterized protein [Apostichopus japonicus]|uniref:uncharacterized protein n=1 Tax=Stichopus japonicus TaxID=307972 RepID=UPI003AB70D67
MAVFGHVGVFDEKLELFADYADRCDAFIAANDVAEEKRAKFFLAVVGVIAYRLLKDLCSPNLPNTKSYGDLKKLLQDHYSPRSIVIAERHRFWTATQGENESISCFIVRLKNVSAHCNFGTFLEEALRDRLVSGLHAKMSKTQTHLLFVADLTFDKAKNKCLADEMAYIATKDYLHTTNIDATNAVYSGQPTHRFKGKAHGSRGSFRYKCKGCGGEYK